MKYFIVLIIQKEKCPSSQGLCDIMSLLSQNSFINFSKRVFITRSNVLKRGDKLPDPLCCFDSKEVRQMLDSCPWLRIQNYNGILDCCSVMKSRKASHPKVTTSMEKWCDYKPELCMGIIHRNHLIHFIGQIAYFKLSRGSTLSGNMQPQICKSHDWAFYNEWIQQWLSVRLQKVSCLF